MIWKGDEQLMNAKMIDHKCCESFNYISLGCNHTNE